VIEQATPSHAASSDEVLALVRQVCRPLEAERVALDDALGRVLREAVCALDDQPPFDRSSVDGYAVRLDDPGPTFRIVDNIRAGDWKPRQLQPGEAVRAATGGALPGDSLQVVMKEDVQADGASLRILRRDAARNIRFRGEDARAGQVLVEAGTLLQHGALGLLASLGHTQPQVTRLPRLLHAVTGDEIVPPEQAPQRGQIRDSNSTLVRAFLKQWGVEPRHLRLPEDEARARAALANDQPPLPGTDLLLVSGGASVGEHDFTRRLLDHLGFVIRVSKTTTRPGKPLIVAQRGGTIAFGLPGNPLAHFVCLNLYVRCALNLFGGRPGEPLFRRGTLAIDLEADSNSRETFWPARCNHQGAAATLTPLRWASSGDLTSLATANALIRVAGGSARLAQGSPVEFLSTLPSA
jgi:molybdopterin molybdotransferase